MTGTTTARSVADLEAVLALEAVAARSWPAPDTSHKDGWLLRAAGGFTGRANSAVPLSPEALASVTVDGTGPANRPAVLDVIAGWYEARGLPTVLALPVPSFDDLHRRLLVQGWAPRGPTLMLTAAIDAVLAACRSSGSHVHSAVDEVPAADWLEVYGRPEARSAPGRDVLAGGGARFATLYLDDGPVAIARWAIDGPWVGLSAVHVAPAYRRRGLASRLAALAMRDARERGASRAWLQVESDNAPALALYRQLGFEVHHEYWYDTRPDDGGRG